jgi:Endosomal/lysosomal potassium channel TMEM175
MAEEKITADRLAAFSDAVFAVIMTIMVLELKAPDEASFAALWSLWPTAVSYVVSYIFIAIIWINHHYLMRFVGPPTLGLIWINFVHLFMVSLLPSLPHGSRAPGSDHRRSCSTLRSLCASTSPTTRLSARFWPVRKLRGSIRARGGWQGAGRLLSLRVSRLRCWSRSLRR